MRESEPRATDGPTGQRTHAHEQAKPHTRLELGDWRLFCDLYATCVLLEESHGVSGLSIAWAPCCNVSHTLFSFVLRLLQGRSRCARVFL